MHRLPRMLELYSHCSWLRIVPQLLPRLVLPLCSRVWEFNDEGSIPYVPYLRAPYYVSPLSGNHGEGRRGLLLTWRCACALQPAVRCGRAGSAWGGSYGMCLIEEAP